MKLGLLALSLVLAANKIDSDYVKDLILFYTFISPLFKYKNVVVFSFWFRVNYAPAYKLYLWTDHFDLPAT